MKVLRGGRGTGSKARPQRPRPVPAFTASADPSRSGFPSAARSLSFCASGSHYETRSDPKCYQSSPSASPDRPVVQGVRTELNL
jgi:hypothetical protein